MKIESSNVQPAVTTPSAAVKTPIDPHRRAYTSPVLRVYGTVRQFTEGATGSLGDGQTGKRPRT